MEMVYLIGADDVRSAGNSMRSAADEMKQAAANIEGALVRHQTFLEAWLIDFERILRNGDMS